ncbi:MAG: histidinol-phosphatase HisJ family protein [Clostridiales bacterium]|nr:histidinol-phosphatase HisJ family protein [Clostridiales bacterium]
MNFASCAHSHTTYCDGKSTPEEMLAAARELGFVSLGFSGHAYQAFDPDYSMSLETQQQYKTHLRQLQRQCFDTKGSPRIWVGLEEDGLAPHGQRMRNRQDFDYIVVSTHYLTTDFEGRSVYVDGEPQLLRRYVDKVLDGDMLAMVRQYYDLHVAALLSAKVDIIGHFDLVRKFAISHQLFDETSPAYRHLALDALERAFPCGGVLEINTGAMARGRREDPYPTQELLGAWREMGGNITITSDCHEASKLDYGYDAAIQLAKNSGFTKALRLGRKRELFEEVDL